jgi:hypothetical protein
MALARETRNGVSAMKDIIRKAFDRLFGSRPQFSHGGVYTPKPVSIMGSYHGQRFELDPHDVVTTYSIDHVTPAKE